MGYSDSDWATRHSTSGFVFQYCRAAVSWGCKKQATIALSSCEAEIVAASEAAKEGVYLKAFLSELGLAPSGPVPLAVDNQSAINVAYNPEHHARVKHIERRHFFVREKWKTTNCVSLLCAQLIIWPTSLLSRWPSSLSFV